MLKLEKKGMTATNMIACCALLFYASISYAQQIHHYNLWTKATVVRPINERIRLDADFQYRTQNNYFGANSPLDHHLLTSYRIWMYSKINSHWQWGFCPLSYFITSPIIQSKEDINNALRKEWRSAISIEYKKNIGKHSYLMFKPGLEYRMLIDNDDYLRTRFKITYSNEVIKKINFSIYEEFFLNTLYSQQNHTFDQNRIGAVISYKLSEQWRLETGIIHIDRLPRLQQSTINEENIQLNIYYTLIPYKI